MEWFFSFGQLAWDAILTDFLKSNCPWIAIVNPIWSQHIILTHDFLEGNVIMAMAVIHTVNIQIQLHI